jgi:hypothetical protein
VSFNCPAIGWGAAKLGFWNYLTSNSYLIAFGGSLITAFIILVKERASKREIAKYWPGQIYQKTIWW